MSELKYIERELELLLDFQPNNEYSKSYLSPKDRIDKYKNEKKVEFLYFHKNYPIMMIVVCNP